MIRFADGVFHLSGEGFSVLLRPGPHGLVEQLHFGAPVEGTDAAALAVRPGTGWGDSILPDEDDPASCPDILPLAWSGAGTGDFRESPIELENAAGPIPAPLRYTGYRLLSAPRGPENGLPRLHGGEDALELTLEMPGVRLRLYWALYGEVLTRRCVLENTGEEPLCLRRLMSFCADLPGTYEMMTLDGGWIAEAHPHITPVGESRVVNENTSGFSSNRHNPGFLLYRPGAGEDHGTVYGFNLIWSGSHYSSARRSLQGLTRVMGGLSPEHFRYPLAPGERFETPEAVLAWSPDGFNGLSRKMHAFVNAHVVPEYWAGRPRPVLYNSWEGCGFAIDQRRLLAQARRAKGLGCELFVLDDGWFTGRSSDRAGLGDYTVDRKKLPEGLAGLAGQINALGLDFGLWLEPEGVNPDSALFRARPEWALPGPLGRHERLLDLALPEVRDYIVRQVSALLDSAPITYVKWDMNRHSCALGARTYDYILGLYDVLRRIFAPRPQVLLETCASGGNRFDLGMLAFSPQIWASDDTDPVERLDIQRGLSYLYPQSAVGAHVSAAPHVQTLRATPLATRGNVSFFGVLGYELDLTHLLPVEEREIRRQISWYKQRRETLQFGIFSRLEAAPGAQAWQAADGRRVVAGVFQRLVHAAPPYEFLALRGLEPGRRYRVSAREQGVRVGPFGELLKYVAPVRLDPNGAVLRAADRRYELKETMEPFCATGAALMAGWALPPRFAGTGYDKSLRVQGDFGSMIFEIEEESR